MVVKRLTASAENTRPRRILHRRVACKSHHKRARRFRRPSRRFRHLLERCQNSQRRCARRSHPAHGAVSEPVARAMAEGAAAKTGADFGIGITGIAGPSGGTPEKPTGTVFIALTERGVRTECRKEIYPTDRETFKQLASQLALDMLRLRISCGGSAAPRARSDFVKASLLCRLRESANSRRRHRASRTSLTRSLSLRRRKGQPRVQ